MATTTQRDYYEILGVPHDADAKTITRAFRRLALKYHPDRSTEPDAQERFKQIAEAYAVLSDPRKRSEYDTRGHRGVAGFTPEDLWAGIDFGDIFGDLGFPGFDTEYSLFERLFGRRTRAGPPQGSDVEVAITIPLALVFSGGQETVAIHRPAPCRTCDGTGAEPGTSPRACPDCGGTGRHVTTARRDTVTVQQITTCPTCEGNGTVIDSPCPDCHGSGEVQLLDTVTVQIPPGIEDGTALRIPGHGMPSAAPGGQVGDAYIIVRTAVDPRFVRRGADLWRPEEVTVPEAVLGTTRMISALDGHVVVNIPPGTQPGTVLNVAGRGLSRPTGAGRGDLHVSVAVRIPDHLGDHERRLYEQLRDALTSDTGN